MQDYDVVANDDHKVGRVAGSEDGYLVVEQGLVRKRRYAIPREVARVDEREQLVRLTVSREVFEEGPIVEDEIDREAVSTYYGIARDHPAPDTLGYGELEPGDPASSSLHEAERHLDESPEEERARVRKQMRPEQLPESAPKGARGIHQDHWKVVKK